MAQTGGEIVGAAQRGIAEVSRFLKADRKSDVKRTPKRCPATLGIRVISPPQRLLWRQNPNYRGVMQFGPWLAILVTMSRNLQPESVYLSLVVRHTRTAFEDNERLCKWRDRTASSHFGQRRPPRWTKARLWSLRRRDWHGRSIRNMFHLITKAILGDSPHPKLR